MFNLGYKEVILNNVNGKTVYKRDNYQIIAGYGEFDENNIVENSEQEAIDPVGEVADWGYVDLSARADALQVHVALTSDAEAKETIAFNAATPAATDILGGYNHWKEIYDISDPKITITGSLTTEVLPGYEDWAVTAFYLAPVVYSNIDGTQIPVSLQKTVTTAGEPGLLYGYMLEESRRFGTFDNTNPYSEHEGGNSQGIVMDGKYTAFYIKYKNDEERNHEFVKHSFVNAEMHMKDYSFVVYVLDEGTNVADFKAVFPLV